MTFSARCIRCDESVLESVSAIQQLEVDALTAHCGRCPNIRPEELAASGHAGTLLRFFDIRMA
jgi:hypothetical protein